MYCKEDLERSLKEVIETMGAIEMAPGLSMKVRHVTISALNGDRCRISRSIKECEKYPNRGLIYSVGDLAYIKSVFESGFVEWEDEYYAIRNSAIKLGRTRGALRTKLKSLGFIK